MYTYLLFILYRIQKNLSIEKTPILEIFYFIPPHPTKISFLPLTMHIIQPIIKSYKTRCPARLPRQRFAEERLTVCSRPTRTKKFCPAFSKAGISVRS